MICCKIVPAFVKVKKIDIANVPGLLEFLEVLSKTIISHAIIQHPEIRQLLIECRRRYKTVDDHSNSRSDHKQQQQVTKRIVAAPTLNSRDSSVNTTSVSDRGDSNWIEID